MLLLLCVSLYCFIYSLLSALGFASLYLALRCSLSCLCSCDDTLFCRLGKLLGVLRTSSYDELVGLVYAVVHTCLAYSFLSEYALDAIL